MCPIHAVFQFTHKITVDKMNKTKHSVQDTSSGNFDSTWERQMMHTACSRCHDSTVEDAIQHTWKHLGYLNGQQYDWQVTQRENALWWTARCSCEFLQCLQIGIFVCAGYEEIHWQWEMLIFPPCVWQGLLVYESFQMKDKHNKLFHCKMWQIKTQEMLLLTMIVVTITVLFSMPDVSLGSKAWSWVRTILSASFQYPIWRWEKDENETLDPTESKLIHASLPIWVNVWKVFCLNRAKQ